MNADNSSQWQTGRGYILSRRLVRQAGQDCVELWLTTDHGPLCLISPPQTNVCFILSSAQAEAQRLIQQHQLAATLESSQFKTLEQQPVSLIRLATEHAGYELRRTFEANGLVIYEGDIRLTDRFLMERFAFGSIKFRGIKQAGRLVDAQVKGSPYQPALSALSLDIECDEHEQLFSVALAGDILNEVILISKHPVTPLAGASFALTCVDDEASLLRVLCQRITAFDPDLVLGWNVKQFDCAILARRAARHNVALEMGRGGTLMQVRQWDSGQCSVDLPGRCIIDGIDALKTMTYHFDSFSLNAVAEELLGEQKLVHDQDQLSAIKALYANDPAQLAAYNHHDCVLVNAIAAHTRFIDFLVLRGTLTGLDMSRPGGSVAAFINVYLPRLHRRRYISGIRPVDGGLASPGGYVMSSHPGLYDYVLVLDFKSLYPSIIRTFKIDPMGLAEGLKDPDHSIEGFKGACFSRDQHFLPDIIANLWAQRDEAKRQQDAPRSQAIKILMNSFYGVLGSGGCPFYDPRLASSITLRGHQIMQTTAQWIEARGHKVIYGDTDSTFVHLDGVADAQTAKQIGLQLQQDINQLWQDKLKQDFDLPCFLELEFETCFDKFFMPTIRGAATGSKKRYAGLIVGGDSQQLIFKGLEHVRSDWTQLAKDFQQELYLKVFNNQPVEAYIRDVLDTIRQGEANDALVYRKRLRKPLNQYTRSTPPHVKAAQWAEQQTGKALYRNRSAVTYVITQAGPQTQEFAHAPLDYEHYIEKQIRPIAESILPSIGISFESIINDQLGLF